MCFTFSAICLIALFSLPELKLYDGSHYELVRTSYLLLGIFHFATLVCPFIFWVMQKIKNKLSASIIIQIAILILILILWYILIVQPAISTFLRYKVTTFD